MSTTPDRGTRFDRFPQHGITDDHGAQFDRFSDQSTSPHGPQYDESFGETPSAEVHHKLNQMAGLIRRLPDAHQRLLRSKLGWSGADDATKSTSSLPAHQLDVQKARDAERDSLSEGPADPQELQALLKQGIEKTYHGSGYLQTIEKNRSTGHPGTVEDLSGDALHRSFVGFVGKQYGLGNTGSSRDGGAALGRGLTALRQVANDVDVRKSRARGRAG